MQLRDPGLFRQQCYIDGAWVGAPAAPAIPVANPATGNTLGDVPGAGAAETRSAIAAAERAWPAWRSHTASERSRILRCIRDLLMQHQEDLAVLMTAEQGKPLKEARGEIAYAASYFEWFAEEAKRDYGDVVPGFAPDRRVVVLRQPVGVVACITPWNFPTAMLARKIAPALAAGCTVVCKPSELTPFSALAIAELGERAGLPPGALNIVTGDAKAIGGELTGNRAVRKLTFTGSTPVGKLLLGQCADSVKKVSMELGGNAPFIVFDDADLDAAVEGAITSKYRNTGQTCVCSNRLLVQSGIYTEFCAALAEATGRLVVGDGLEGDTDQGPLINEAAVEKVEEHIADALALGARILAGGERHPLGGTFFAPTVLADATPAMRVAREETFGPVAPVFRFDSEKEAVRMANDTEFGLAAYVYTRDHGRAWRVPEALEYGMVGLNTGLISTEVAPFGGIKESGMGREGSRYGLDDYTELKYLCIAGVD